jgi:hypothetical protein
VLLAPVCANISGYCVLYKINVNANPETIGLGLQAEATRLVTEIWERVFTASNKVIAQSGIYGFHAIQLIPNPNIHQMLQSMRVVAVMLDEIISEPQDFAETPDDFRLVLNAREQLTKLESVAAALIVGDEKLYEESIEKLKQQAAF